MSLELSNYGVEVDSFLYRDQELRFYEDILGHQIVAIWNNQVFQFGVMNTSYREDMKLVVDDFFDTITRFEALPMFYGAKLEYFQNHGFRDIRLSYRGRVLKVFLNPESINSEDLKRECLELLQEELEFRSGVKTSD